MIVLPLIFVLSALQGPALLVSTEQLGVDKNALVVDARPLADSRPDISPAPHIWTSHNSPKRATASRACSSPRNNSAPRPWSTANASHSPAPFINPWL